MGRTPINVLIARGKSHLTKKEIAERRATEIEPNVEGIEPPSYLTAKQKREFDEIANQLDKLGILGETDCDVLAMYIVSKDEWNRARKLQAKALKEPDIDISKMGAYGREVDRAYKRCIAAARELGLTISARCKLVVPKAEEYEKENKFAKFMIDCEKKE